jgi:phosphopantothenoylcysteine synthetase/decarboxylase
MTPQGVLYLVACGAPPARDVHVPAQLALNKGWDVCVILTPQARKFADAEALQLLTGHPIRSEYKNPDEPDILPPADAIVVAPATFNTINKWAAGISDTLALGLLTEAIGKGLPLVALPFLNSAQARHPAFARSVKELQSCGVRVLLGRDVYSPHEPGTGSRYLHLFPWSMAVEALG